MGWLRKERDVIGLFVVWAILLQSITFAFTYGLHAATLVSGSEQTVICSSQGVRVVPGAPTEDHRKNDCQCCHMSCRQTCGGAGILPALAHIPLPPFTVIAAAAPRADAPALTSASDRLPQPRAPPFA